MTYSGKISVLGSDGYPYWNGRMEALLVSQSQDIWNVTQSTTFVVLPVAERTTQDIVAQHEANAKAVNFLFSGLGPMDYERVSHLKTVREIWSLLSTHHEGTATIKARLVETYRREYENFVQKPGESVDDLFGRFQSIINKLRVNSAPAALPYTDHQQAVKLLFALDRKIWEIKLNSIIESAGYDTIGVEALYSKLKATEVDYKMRDSLACTGSKSLALATPSSESVTNLMLHNFSFSALMSVTEEQLATLGDDELCLVSSRFQRAYDNRMSKKRGERPKCFECGEVGPFITECPNKNDYYKKGKSYFRDSDKYHPSKASFDKHRFSKHGSSKRPFGKKNFRKAFKSYQKDNRKRDKAFFAEVGFCSSGSSSSSSSSSSSDEEITYRKDKRNDQGGPAGLCFVSTKSRRKNKDKRRSVCSMALEDKENKDDGSNSSSDDEDRGMEDVWIMDSGCSRHMTGHRKWFSNLNPMSRKFEMSLMGELQFFLGLQIKQGPEGTFIHQAKYTRDILKKFEMGDSKPMTTPMSTNTALDADEDGEAVDQKEFRGMIGSLLYLTATRPDIQFAVCLCARYQASPRTSHRQAVKRIFRLQVQSIDNALIKGEIESQWTGLIALLV
ncbi:hypothetical protein U9M48_043627 [Paspalum notatum var. saurae]|uniref:Reverse transcriptase Ty1/copia-type domain-containing protein n=1 Tax=Paspalum notatum var. saurae TaxID=547442 RepID=A0AAQ3XIS3_PASNO